MLFRPLFLVSIVLAAVTAAAQFSPIEADVSNTSSHYVITGSVRDINNHPLGGVRVDLQDTFSGRFVASTFTFTNGTFEIRDVPKGGYDVIASVGLRETRGHVDYPGNGDISLRMPQAVAADNSASSSNSVSMSQMKVPGKARKMLQKAMDAFRMSKLDDAFSFVQKALGMYPDYAQALTLRGVMNLQRGDTKQAEPDLQKAVELDYADDRSFVALASLYNTEGKFDDALLILDRGMSVHPNSWAALVEKARAQIGKREFDAGLKTLAKADKYIPPTIAYPHLFRAQALLGLNNAPGAILEINNYLAQEPTGANAETARRMLAKLGAPSVQEEAKK